MFSRLTGILDLKRSYHFCPAFSSLHVSEELPEFQAEPSFYSRPLNFPGSSGSIAICSLPIKYKSRDVRSEWGWPTSIPLGFPSFFLSHLPQVCWVCLSWIGHKDRTGFSRCILFVIFFYGLTFGHSFEIRKLEFSVFIPTHRTDHCPDPTYMVTSCRDGWR